MMRRRLGLASSARLEEWIDDAIHSGLVFLARFARVLRRDIDAVCNAIDLPWSNGQAEGQINGLKTIKRAMSCMAERVQSFSERG